MATSFLLTTASGLIAGRTCAKSPRRLPRRTLQPVAVAQDSLVRRQGGQDIIPSFRIHRSPLHCHSMLQLLHRHFLRLLLRLLLLSRRFRSKATMANSGPFHRLRTCFPAMRTSVSAYRRSSTMEASFCASAMANMEWPRNRASIFTLYIAWATAAPAISDAIRSRMLLRLCQESLACAIRSPQPAEQIRKTWNTFASTLLSVFRRNYAP